MNLRKMEQLTQLVKEFCEARGWEAIHNPKDLAIGVITEASELLEHFRFLTPAQCNDALRDPEQRRAISHELADVLFLVLRFAQVNEIDLAEALRDKIQITGQKYPVPR